MLQRLSIRFRSGLHAGQSRISMFWELNQNFAMLVMSIEASIYWKSHWGPSGSARGRRISSDFCIKLWCLTTTHIGQRQLLIIPICCLKNHWSPFPCLWLKKHRDSFIQSCEDWSTKYEDQPSRPSRFHFFGSLFMTGCHFWLYATWF